MDPDHMQAIAERDQFWTSLRALAPEILVGYRAGSGGTWRAPPDG